MCIRDRGITTDISGHCGTSNAPKDPATLRHEEEKLGRPVGSMNYLSSYGKTIAQLESMKLGVNMAQYVGHGSIRAIVCQGENQNRPLTKKELDHMEGLLKEAMEEGAMGVSFGLIYPPGSYADLDELVAAAKVAARYDRSFSVHMRSESLRLVESVEDMIEVARRADCRALLSHHKAKGRVNWDKTTLTLPLIERANQMCIRDRDVEWFMRHVMAACQLDFWFGPDVDLQRQGLDSLSNEGVIQPGDLLHCDIGVMLKYIPVLTDKQWMAYVRRPGETAPPQGLEQLFSQCGRFQEITRSHFLSGTPGNQVFHRAVDQGKAEGLCPQLYCHGLGVFGHGPGPIIGRYDYQDSIYPRGEYPVGLHSSHALDVYKRQV